MIRGGESCLFPQACCYSRRRAPQTGTTASRDAVSWFWNIDVPAPLHSDIISKFVVLLSPDPPESCDVCSLKNNRLFFRWGDFTVPYFWIDVHDGVSSLVAFLVTCRR